MNCMKCGRETEEEQVFCRTCLDDMEAHPVKPGTVVLIPSRAEEEESRKNQHRKKTLPTPSEQIRRLKRKLLWTRIALASLLLLCGLLCFAVGRVAIEWDAGRIMGQNYSTVETATNATTP